MDPLPQLDSSIVPIAVQRLLTVATQKERPDHRQFLELVVDSLNEQLPDRSVLAVLWLRDWIKNRFLVDLCAAGRQDIPQDFSLISIVVPGPNFDSKDDNYLNLSKQGIDENSGRVLELATNLGVTAGVESFPLWDAGADEIDNPEAHKCRLIGFLQVWSSIEFSPTEIHIVHWTASALASNLYRTRRRRELRMVRELQKAFEKDDLECWFKTAAEAVSEATSADFCIVFGPAPKKELNGVAAWSRNRKVDLNPGRFVAGPESVIRKLFENPRGVIRLDKFTDDVERTAVFGSDKYDDRLEAEICRFVGIQGTWMASTIVAHDQPLGVIVLLNKSKNLPRQFSATDESIVGAACKYLASVLPSVLARRMMEAAAGGEGAILARLGTREEVVETGELNRLFEALQGSIPNIIGATLWISKEESGTDGDFIHLGGDDFLLRTPSPLNSNDRAAFSTESTDKRNESPYFYVFKVPGLRTSRAKLGVMLCSSRLSDHEQQMLTLFARAVLTNQLRAREVAREQLRTIIEIRHNIRAGLNGLNHLTVAMNYLTAMHQKQYSNASQLASKVFKSVRRAQMFAEQSRILMEESRLIYSELSKADLRVKKEQLGIIVREVVLAVSIDAEAYKVKVNLEDAIPKNEMVEIDRNLIYILFFNLIDNAVKYSREHGSVRVRLYLADRKWHMEVENTGPFLDDKAQHEIFLPFVRRFDSSLRKARPGTGLGLPTSRLIARAHQGDLEITSILVSTTSESKPTGLNTFSVSAPRWIQ